MTSIDEEKKRIAINAEMVIFMIFVVSTMFLLISLILIGLLYFMGMASHWYWLGILAFALDSLISFWIAVFIHDAFAM